MIINKCIVVSDYATDWLEKVLNQANLDGYYLLSAVMANNKYNCECMYLFFGKEIKGERRMTEYINKEKLIKAIEDKRPLNWNDTEAELAEQGAFDYIMELIKGFCDDETDRINELVEADKEGRCLVLPCKEGKKVYKINFHLFKGCPPEIYESVFHVTDYYGVGNTVFFTKEEAEKALEGLK